MSLFNCLYSIELTYSSALKCSSFCGGKSAQKKTGKGSHGATRILHAPCTMPGRRIYMRTLYYCKKDYAIRETRTKKTEGLIVNLQPPPLAMGRPVGVIKGAPGRLLVH